MGAIRPQAKSISGAATPALQRADGGVELGFTARHGRTSIAHLYQHDPGRVLFPDEGAVEPLQAVVVTTSGGLTGGDRFRVGIDCAAGCAAMVTSQAAEKIYRSAGSDCAIEIDISVADGAALEWMPQETILFEGARLRRRTAIELAANSRLLAGEMMIFGRTARQERFTKGLLHDVWQVRRAGRLIWHDVLRLERDIATVIDHPAGFDGAVACATIVHASPAPQDILQLSRGLLADPNIVSRDLRAGATELNGLVLVRWLARDAVRLRHAYSTFWRQIRAAQGLQPVLPRVWNC